MSEPYETPEYRQAQQALHVENELAGDASAREAVAWTLPYLKAADWVLDLGCKTGEEQQVWREHGIYNTIGLDLFPEKALQRGLVVIQRDMHVLPFSDGAFDAVYCRDTLEHSPLPARVVREVRRVLKPGGLFFLIGPIGHDAPYHFAIFQPEDYHALLGDFERLEENGDYGGFAARARRPGEDA